MHVRCTGTCGAQARAVHTSSRSSESSSSSRATGACSLELEVCSHPCSLGPAVAEASASAATATLSAAPHVGVVHVVHVGVVGLGPASLGPASCLGPACSLWACSWPSTCRSLWERSCLIPASAGMSSLSSACCSTADASPYLGGVRVSA
jgi:hypothetical protein